MHNCVLMNNAVHLKSVHPNNRNICCDNVQAAVEAHLAAGEASSTAAQMQLMPEHGIDPSSKPGYEELKKEAVAKVKEKRRRTSVRGVKGWKRSCLGADVP